MTISTYKSISAFVLFALGATVATFFLVAPQLARAAYNDVTLTTDTIISVGGVTINVSGSSASLETIAVGASSFTVTLQSGSSLTVTASGLKKMSASTEPAISTTATCNSSTSSLTFSASTGATVTVTPDSSTTCAAATASSSGGGGGPIGLISSGGGGATSATPATPAASASPAIPASQAFSADFGLGAKGGSVTTLQNFLEAKGFLTMPTGIAKGTFGALTRSAVRAYQKSKGISATGFVGPLTRALLNSSIKTEATQTTSTASFSFTTNMQLGSRGGDVTELQKLLIAQGFLNAEATGYFGKLTEAAVRAYQTKNGISSIGIVGPATRASLNK